MTYLKIKDDKDLKELEKFGFSTIRVAMGTFACFDYKYDSGVYRVQAYDKSQTIEIDPKNRAIKLSFEPYYTVNPQWSLLIIFDLIQAGLVEKVVEK